MLVCMPSARADSLQQLRYGDRKGLLNLKVVDVSAAALSQKVACAHCRHRTNPVDTMTPAAADSTQDDFKPVVCVKAQQLHVRRQFVAIVQALHADMHQITSSRCLQLCSSSNIVPCTFLPCSMHLAAGNLALFQSWMSRSSICKLPSPIECR
jgi:hypothetical protein